MKEETTFFVRLRDCFNAGYTMPQFCIDNGIKKPLFVALDEDRIPFLWEIHVQFQYDLRLKANFALLEGKHDPVNFPGPETFLSEDLEVKNISEVAGSGFDAAIMLTALRMDGDNRIINLEDLTKRFMARTYAEIPILHFMQRHPGVKLILTNFPNPADYGGEEYAYSLVSLKYLREKLKKDTSGNVETPFDKFGYTNSEVREMIDGSLSVLNLNDNTIFLQDNDNPLLNIKNGKRKTADQPEHYKNKIHIVGLSHHVGIGAPFDKTIASYLQKMFNENNLPYRVENESQYFWSVFQHIFYNLNNLDLNAGDIIFMWVANLRPKNIPFFDVSRAFDPPYDYRELFSFSQHSNELGYKIIAENFFELLVKNDFFQNTEFKYPEPPPPPHRYGIPKEFSYGNLNSSANKDLEEYKQKLRERRLKIGATVMNCNPFTLGRKHLIEYAAAKVAKLYVFVVEEDKSEFKFADRLKLVQHGVKNLSNVEVIPSGQFIISQKTFSG